MKIGRLTFGTRAVRTQFKWFYCPLLKDGDLRKNYHFFWWIGRRWYVALHKKGVRNV